MESSFSSQQLPAPTNISQYEAFRTQVRWLLRGGSSDASVPRTPPLEEHPAYRTKRSSRLSFRFFGNRNEAPAVEANPILGVSESLPASADPAMHPTVTLEASDLSSPPTRLQNSRGRDFHRRQLCLNPPATVPHIRKSRTRNPREQRRYAAAWVRRPVRKYGLFSSRGISFHAALKDRAIRRSLIRCCVAGLLLIIVLAICTNHRRFPRLVVANHCFYLTVHRSGVRSIYQLARRSRISYSTDSFDHANNHCFLPLSCVHLHVGDAQIEVLP
jgi:hypothetical protein